MRKGAVGNVGVGIADGIGLVAREEGCADDFVLTVETGPVGGITSGRGLRRQCQYPRNP